MDNQLATIRDHFLAALEHDGLEAQLKYVAEHCSEMPEMRGQLEDMLRAHHQPEGFLASRGDASPTVDQPITEQPGDTIGPYKLVERFGEGGMGVVYMAEQAEPVERRVALKIIKPGMDTQQVIARFEAERQALAAMDHPNIAKVLDGGTTDSGRPYFVMELVSGIPITEFCDQQQLDVPGRLQLFADVCHAVQHAHQKGIIHRDIKPSNILVALYDEHPVPKVIDFGVAKAIRQTLTEQTIFTQLGQIVGTLEYMSPEQADPHQRDIDTRSDIYSLGVLLYELLTGETPFERQRLRSAAFDEIMRIIREEEPPRPSHRLSSSHSLPAVAANRHTEPKKLSSVVHGELDWIVMKALEKDRARRYETANGLAADVGRYLSNEPVVAGPPSVRYRFSKFVRRNRAMIATGSVIVVLLVAGIAGTTWQATRAIKERRRTETALEQSEAVVGFLVNDLLGSAAPERTLGREVTVKEVLANTEEKIETAFRDQPLVEARVRAMLGQLYSQLGNYELAESQLTASLRIRTRLLGNDDPQTIWTKDALANVWSDLGQQKKAQKLLEQTLETSRRALGVENKVTLILMNDLARVFSRDGQTDKALGMFEQTLEIQRRVLGEEHRHTLQTMNNLAVELKRQGQWERARELCEQTLEVRRRTLGPEDPRTVNSMANLAVVLSQMGQLEEARKLDEQSYEIRSRVLGADHPDTLCSMNNLAIVLFEQGRLEEARGLLEEAVRITNRLEGEGDVRFIELLADVMIELRHLEDARKLLEQAIQIQRRIVGEEHLDTLNSMNSLGIVLFKQGRLEEAGKLQGKRLEICRRVLGDEHPDTLHSMHNLATVFTQQGQLEEARKIHVTALEIRGRVLGDEHPDTLHSINNLATVSWRQGNLEEARKLYEQAAETRRRVLGEGHADTLRSMGNQAFVSSELGDLGEFHRLHEEMFDIRQRVLGEEHPLTMNNLAWSLVIDPDQPFADAERAVALASKAVDRWPESSAYLGTLGLAHHRAGDPMRAIEVLEKALNSSGDEGHDFCCLAMAHWQLGNEKEARRCFEQAVAWTQDNDPNRKKLHLYRLIVEAAELLQVADPFESISKAAHEPSGPPIDLSDERETQNNSSQEETNDNRPDSTDKRDF